ncbi:hypothetical protein EON66_08375 [archaeon]|nr:MAG: hypothetical protein EON66_08375 [archaeon]
MCECVCVCVHANARSRGWGGGKDNTNTRTQHVMTVMQHAEKCGGEMAGSEAAAAAARERGNGTTSAKHGQRTVSSGGQRWQKRDTQRHATAVQSGKLLYASSTAAALTLGQRCVAWRAQHSQRYYYAVFASTTEAVPPFTRAYINATRASNVAAHGNNEARTPPLERDGQHEGMDG